MDTPTIIVYGVALLFAGIFLGWNFAIGFHNIRAILRERNKDKTS